MSLPPTNTLEITAEMDLQSTSSVHFGIKGGGGDPVTMSFNGLELRAHNGRASLPLAKGERKLKLRIFIDRSVLEVFVNETVCVTKTIAPLEAHATLEIRAEDGEAKAKRVQAWPMRTIW